VTRVGDQISTSIRSNRESTRPDSYVGIWDPHKIDHQWHRHNRSSAAKHAERQTDNGAGKDPQKVLQRFKVHKMPNDVMRNAAQV
jgi:hypothetical protein